MTEYFYAPSLSGGNKEFLGDMYCRMTSGGDYFIFASSGVSWLNVGYYSDNIKFFTLSKFWPRQNCFNDIFTCIEAREVNGLIIRHWTNSNFISDA